MNATNEVGRKKIGFIFPGQGSQTLGAGKELYDHYRLIQECFEEASGCLETNFVQLCFASSDRELQQTINAQTSIFLLSAAIYRVLHETYCITPDVVAGHSSGEYSALYAAGGMTFFDTLYLLSKRALFMDEATRDGNGGMLAILGLEDKVVEELCQRYDAPDSDTHVAEVVNYNTPGQVVISGTLPELEAIAQEVKKLKGKAIKLNVAGAFHSRLMCKAAEKFAQYLVKVDFKDLTIPLIANKNAQIITTADEVKEAVVEQMSSPVLWWQSIQQLADCDIIVECGPGGKHTKMLQALMPKVKFVAIQSLNDIEELLRLLGKNVVVHRHNEACYHNNEECEQEPITIINEACSVTPPENDTREL